MLKKNPIIFTFFCILCTLAFAANKDTKVTKPVIKKIENIFTEDNPNILITAAQPEFTIKLKSNPTTGYSWFLRDYDINLITPLKHSYQKAEGDLIGAPGFELWTFKVKPAGMVVPQQTVMRFTYTRPWQGADGATQVAFRLTTQGN